MNAVRQVTSVDSLQLKIAAFEATLSELEVRRFKQLMRCEVSGVLGAEPDASTKSRINSSLATKLAVFQTTLTSEEAADLVLRLAGRAGAHQSSFGVEP